MRPIQCRPATPAPLASDWPDIANLESLAESLVENVSGPAGLLNDTENGLPFETNSPSETNQINCQSLSVPDQLSKSRAAT